MLRCPPVGDVTLRNFFLVPYALHSSTSSIHVKTPLYEKYRKERRIWGEFAIRTVAITPAGPDKSSVAFREIKASGLRWPRPSDQR